MLNDFVGFGSLSEALQFLEEGKYRKIFVVASRPGWRRFNPNGTRPFFSGREIELFSDFSVNPDFREMQKGCERLRAFNPDLIVAIGGGSALDVAKVIKALAFTKEPFDPGQPSTLKPSGDGPPLVAVATTAGSGAEATQFAVFYLGEDKQSLSHPSLRPDIAVADPEMTYSLPPEQTAATGFDAVAQAIEAYWAVAAAEEARELAMAAVRYALPNLYNAVHTPEPSNRYHMMQAAYLAGKALNFTRTTMPHALGYHLTKRYGLAHGHAVSLTLPYFFILNLDPSLPVNAEDGREALDLRMGDIFASLGQKDARDSFLFWRNLMAACGLAATFEDIGLTTREQFEALAATVNPERMKNHPVAIDPGYLVEFFMKYR